MTTNDPQDIEKTLLSLSPQPVPPGLRERILESAAKRRRDLVMTPWMWAAAAACAALIAVAVLGDAAVARAQNENLRALLNGRNVPRETEGEAAWLSAELFEEMGGSGKSGLERLAALTRRGPARSSPRDVFESRERLKGWLDHEDESTENLY